MLSAKGTATALITALTIASTAAAPVSAGERERDFLKGALATAAIGTIVLGITNQNRTRQPAPVYNYAPAPVYKPAPVYRPAPVYSPAPVYNYVEPRYEQPRYTSSIYSTAAARAFNSYSLTERRAIQRQLAARGYYFGGIDGAFGPGTYNAITAYAADSRATGRLDSTAGAFAVYDGLILG